MEIRAFGLIRLEHILAGTFARGRCIQPERGIAGAESRLAVLLGTKQFLAVLHAENLTVDRADRTEVFL